MARKKKKKGTAEASKKRKEKLQAGYPLGRKGERITAKPPASMSPEQVARSEAEAERQRVKNELGI